MKKLVLVFSFLFVVSLGFADNMVSNPGFENWTAGSPDDWTTAGGAITLTQNTTIVHGGSSSCEVIWTSTSNQYFRSNIFSVTAGSSINASVWMYDNDAGGRGRLCILYTGASNYYGGYSTDQANWQEITYSSTVPTGATDAQIELRFYDVSPFPGSATVLVDDVTYDHPVSGALSISNISRQYPVPTSSQTCWVQCDITGGTVPYTALIIYSVNGVNQSDISMSNTGGDTYQVILPVQSDGARVAYYIDVIDNAKANVTSSTYGLFWGTSNISNSSGNIKAVDVNGVLSYDGYYARVTGVATVASGVYSTSSVDVYFQDNYGGINIYKSGASTVTITKGNSYTVFGVIDQYNGKAEIIPDDAGTDITDNGASSVPSVTIKTIAQFLADPETYEGMLIGIQHLSKVSGTWPSSGSDANLIMTDDGGTSEITLRVDKDTDLDDNPEPAWPKDVVGIMSQHDSSSPYDSGYQIIPRSYDDILDDGTLPVILSSFTAQFIGSLPILCWTTQSEDNNAGWNVYRGESADAFINGSAIKINTEFIAGAGTTSIPTDYVFEDEYEVIAGTEYWYILESVDYSGETFIHGSVSLIIPGEGTAPELPQLTILKNNYPNPFNPDTIIYFSVKENETAQLSIFNTKGQTIETKTFEAGIHNYFWDASSFSSGQYFYRLESDSYSQIKKMTLIK